jgi:tight adherence protein B
VSLSVPPVPPVSTVLAAGLAAVLVSLLLPMSPARGLGLPASMSVRTSGEPSSAARSSTLLLVTGVAGVMVLWSWLSPRRFVLTLLLGAVVWAVGRVVRRRRAARAAERRSEQVLAACESMASDLAAGQPPLLTLDRAAAEWEELAPVATAGRLGADVPAVLRELAGRPGARQLRTLAATWQVAHDTGSGLAGAIAQAAESIRSERRTARLVAAELASARATARMLAALPLGVLALGTGIGGDPVGFLVDTVPGLACLASGLALSFAGLFWLERIADRVLHR